MNIMYIAKKRFSASLFATLTIVSLVLSAFPAAFFVAEAATDTLFSDSFETEPAFSSPVWTSSPKWGTSASAAYDLNRKVKTEGNTNGPASLESQTIDATGYESVELSFWYKQQGFESVSDDNDNVKVEWYDGSSWNLLETFVGESGDADDVNDWTQWTGSLGAAADNNANIKLRFTSDLDAGNDKFFLDLVELTAEEQVIVTPPTPKTEVEIDVYGDTSAGENQPGWLFNRDVTTATPFEFNSDESVIGNGALYVLPITNTYPVATKEGNDKFIAEYFWAGKIADLTEFTYDFLIGSGGDASDENEFYLNVYANFGQTAVDNFYDCRYNVVPTVGSTGSFTTVTFDPTQSYPVTTRGSSPYTCPAVPADMDNDSPDSTIRVFAINMGDTSSNDTGLDGYFDNVVLEDDTTITTFDLEPIPDTTAPDVTVKDGAITCEDGYHTVSFKLHDAGKVDKVVINGVEKDLTNNVWSDLNGVEPGKFGAVEGINVMEVYDVAGNVTEFIFTLCDDPSSAPTATVKEGSEFTETCEAGYYLLSFKLHDADDIDRVVINGVEKDLTDNEWSDVNFLKPGVFGAVAGENTMVVYDVLGNNSTYTFFLCEPVQQCENLLVNGSFEEPEVTNKSLWQKFVSVPGWIIEKVSDDSATTLELMRGWSGNEAADGEQYAELDGDHSSKVSQSVATLKGGEYELKWAFAPRHGISADQNQLSVLIDGSLVASEGPSTSPAGLDSEDWKFSSYTFTAESDETTITFADAGPSNSFGTFLDDAQLCLVKEPEPVVTVHTSKIVCTDEADLPNWGNGAPNITEATAADWLAENPNSSCSLVEGWEFEWAPKGAADPGDTLVGPAGGDWTTFTGSVEIPVSEIDGDGYFWMREVLQVDYIPFTHEATPNNSDKFTAEMYCHTDGLNYDNYDRIDNPKADKDYYCVAWNVPEEVVVEAPYCGDGEVNQEWEMCEPGEQDCTEYCTWANQCTDLKLAKIDFKEALASISFDKSIILGAEGKTVPEGVWFNLDDVKNGDLHDLATDNEGLVLSNNGSELGFAVWGGNPHNKFDYVFADIQFKGVELGSVNDSNAVINWPLEDGGDWVDVFDVDGDESIDMEWYLTTGGDAASIAYTMGEEYDCPECDAEVEARVVLQEGEDIFNNGTGNLNPVVILGDGTEVAFGEWFKVSEATSSVSAAWIDDYYTVTNYDDPQNKAGLFVSREGNGDVKVALYGFHNPGGDANYESLRATIEFNDASVADVKEIPGQFKLENHSETDGTLSNDNFDSFSQNLTSVDFDFWVDTAADGITITLGDVAFCEDDTTPEEEMYLIDGHKYHGEYEGEAELVSGWEIELYDEYGLYAATTTDEYGYYYFWVPAGEYEVYEVMQDGWYQTGVDAGDDYEYTDDKPQSCYVAFPDEEDYPVFNSISLLINQVEYNYADYRCDFYNEQIEDEEPEDEEPEPEERRSSRSSGTRVTNLVTPTPLVAGASTSQCPFITDFMQIGIENNSFEVMKLQLFLRIIMGYELEITGEFDVATDAAVKLFQEHYRSEILTPWFEQGIVPHDEPTGFVYKTTRWKINDIVCPGSEAYPSFEGEDLSHDVDID